MGRRGKSGVAVLALVGCSAVGLAVGGCSGGSSGSSGNGGSSSSSGSGISYAEVVQVTGTSTRSGAGGSTWKSEASDPRVSGDRTANPQCEMTGDDQRTIGFCTVTNTITNDRGTWEGGCTGTVTWTVTEPETMHDFDCTMIGAGDYLGLRYRYNIQGGDEDAGPWSFTGQIESFSPPSAS